MTKHSIESRRVVWLCLQCFRFRFRFRFRFHLENFDFGLGFEHVLR